MLPTPMSTVYVTNTIVALHPGRTDVSVETTLGIVVVMAASRKS